MRGRYENVYIHFKLQRPIVSIMGTALLKICCSSYIKKLHASTFRKSRLDKRIPNKGMMPIQAVRGVGKYSAYHHPYGLVVRCAELRGLFLAWLVGYLTPQ